MSDMGMPLHLNNKAGIHLHYRSRPRLPTISTTSQPVIAKARYPSLGILAKTCTLAQVHPFTPLYASFGPTALILRLARYKFTQTPKAIIKTILYTECETSKPDSSQMKTKAIALFPCALGKDDAQLCKCQPNQQYEQCIDTKGH